MQSKNCQQCGKEFFKTANLSQKTWETGRRFCSNSCRGKGVPNPKKGKHYPHLGGENHPNWKGDKVGYYGIHHWVAKTLGKPKLCAHCGTTEGTSRHFHWANISRTYKRDVADWMRLCVKCHVAYDNIGYKPGNATAFKKGHATWNKGLHVRLNPDGEFKKGMTPWNKKVA